VAESKFLNSRLVKVVGFMENISGGVGGLGVGLGWGWGWGWGAGQGEGEDAAFVWGLFGGGIIGCTEGEWAEVERYGSLLSAAAQRAIAQHLSTHSPVTPTPPTPIITIPKHTVKDSAEKDAFFKRLPALLPAIPGPVAVRKLLPLLSNALEFGGAPASAVGSLLQIGRPLPPEEFLRRVVPCLTKLFASSDRNLRRNLLEAVDVWGPHLSQVRVLCYGCALLWVWSV